MSMLTAACTFTVQAQSPEKYDPSVQPKEMQYFTPAGGSQFVGDCIPFFHDGTFYLYWLLDEGHHASLNGLGGHQWCVSTTRDLKTWTHHPIAIGIDEDWEKSICTGSVVSDGNKFYAFYATRLLTADNSVSEQLSYATSTDALTFTKQKPNPFYTSAPGYSTRHFRDPKVTIDDKGIFHLFVSSEKNEADINEGHGCLVHMTSSDLKTWQIDEPVLSGTIQVPECPDYFEWNGWYYLVYGQGGDTYYLKSRSPYGPWEYPESQALLEPWVNVAKTAAFTGGRRIVAGWVPSRNGNTDFGGELFGGCVALREAVQLENGDLATKFPEEVMPHTAEPLNLDFIPTEGATVTSPGNITVDARGNICGARATGVPNNCIITLDVIPSGNYEEFGMFLRSEDKGINSYKMSFNPDNRTVRLHDSSINAVTGLDKPMKLTIVMKNDIIDVCIDNRRCIVNRLPEKKGGQLWFFARNGEVKFENIKVCPIVSSDDNLAENTLLPSYRIDKSNYSVTAMVFNDNIHWNDWSAANGGKTGVILGTPPTDSNGRKWYENGYTLTDDGKRKWNTLIAPMETGSWADTDISADIYFRREFKIDKNIEGRLIIKSAFDDAPCEIYINGTLIKQYADGDPDGSLAAQHLLTDEQMKLIKTDGTPNLLAMHVHNDYGGSNADVGLYIAEKPYTILSTHEYGSQYNNIIAADLFNDGNKQIWIAGNDGFDEDKPHWLLRKENGVWKQTEAPINCVDRPSLSVCDFNGDGIMDIVCFENRLPSDEETSTGKYTSDKGIYLGNGDGTFNRMEINITGAEENLPSNFSRPFSNMYMIRSGAVADFNNDGRPDIVGIGYSENNVVLINEGTEGDRVTLRPIYFDDGIIEGSAERRGRSFSEGFVMTADFNNDGYSDFIVSSNNWDYRQNVDADWERFTEVYLNDGTGTKFNRTYWGRNNLSVYNGGIAIADFNNDGFLDLFVSGDGGFWPGTPNAIELTGASDQGYWEHTMVYINDGTGHFNTMPEEKFDRLRVKALNSVSNMANAFDWDGDGNIDILYQGWSPDNNEQAGYIWMNNGDSGFSRETVYGGGSESSAIIADWDGDGAKDILTTGYCDNRNFIDHNYSDRRTFIVTQNNNESALQPEAPSSVSATADNGYVTISWTPAASAPKNTTYELYIRNSEGTLLGNCRAYTDNERNGQRKVEEFGNLGTVNKISYKLKDDTYTVGVQAVNGQREGSRFTTTTFVLDNGTLTDISDIRQDDNSADSRSYTLNGQFIGKNADSMGRGVYIVDNKKILKK